MKTVLNTMLAACEDALCARKPIIILATEEMELIHRLAASDRLVTRMYQPAPISGCVPLSETSTEGEVRLYSGFTYRSKVQNVFTFSSAAEFSQAVLKASEENYGIPDCGNGSDGNYYDSSRFPNLYLIHGVDMVRRAGTGEMAEFPGFYHYVDRYLQERDDNSKVASSCLMIYGDPIDIPERLKHYTVVVDEPYPDREEIAFVIRRKMADYGLKALGDSLIQQYVNALTGFRLLEIERLMDYFARYPEQEGLSALYHEELILELITKRKVQMIRQDQILELVSSGTKARTGTKKGNRSENSPDNSEIGGMAAFLRWLKLQMPSICNAGKFTEETGGIPCKGVLMCGIPGCGKSLAAKAVAAQSGLPLIKMDIGRLMGKYVGESEHNLAKALRQAEAMSPCILWIDEIEKGFGGVAGGSDDDVSKRMFGSLLTWLQECREPVFNFATANDISGMPKEFFRSGRFDALFSMYMPTHAECVDILQKQMQMVDEKIRKQSGEKRRLFETRDLKTEAVGQLFDELQASQPRMRFMTGADINKLVNLGLRRIWTENAAGTMPYPIERNQWLKCLRAALSSTTVYGDGSENRDSISACYIRLLHSNFAPCADNPIFEERDYMVSETQDGGYSVTIGGLTPERKGICAPYDLEMRSMLARRMESIGPAMETAIRRRLLGL